MIVLGDDQPVSDPVSQDLLHGKGHTGTRLSSPDDNQATFEMDLFIPNGKALRAEPKDLLYTRFRAGCLEC